MKQMRENFHIKIRDERRQKEFAKRRVVKLVATPQLFKEAIQQNPIQDLLKILDLDCLQLLSFLSTVEDYQCNLHLVQEGVLDMAIEISAQLVKEYKHTTKDEAKLNYLLSIIGNLIDFVNFPNVQIIDTLKQCLLISTLSTEDLIITLVWLIDELTNKLTFKDDILQPLYQFLYNNLIRRNITSSSLDSILNLQFKQAIIINQDNITELVQCFFSPDISIIQKSLFVLVNIIECKENVQLCEETIQRLNELFQNKDFLPLLKLSNLLYPKISLESQMLLQRLENCIHEQKLEEYIDLINKYIADNIIIKEDYVYTLKQIDMTYQSRKNKELILQQISLYQG